MGQFDPGNNRGSYTLSLIDAEDGKVLATTALDMSHTHPDAMGFKYAKVVAPVRLESSSRPIVIYPRGLRPSETYEVRGSNSGLNLHQTGAKLMAQGIQLDKVPAGELIFLNLPGYPGSGTDHVAPSAPSRVTKRVGSNLGVQGIEVSWTPGEDENWISYYQIRKNGESAGRVAKGTFFFDHSRNARDGVNATFEVAAVDGDGNRSAFVVAQEVAGEPKTYEAMGDFSPNQAMDHWIYEQTNDDAYYEELTWDKGGYEGRWTGSGLGRIGRIWMQPSATFDVSRTFVVPASGTIETYGEIRKDPSAENKMPAFVRIVQNLRQIWPPEGWAEVAPTYDSPIRYKLADRPVAVGDKIRFVVKHNGENRADPIVWDPIIILRSADKPESATAKSR